MAVTDRHAQAQARMRPPPDAGTFDEVLAGLGPFPLDAERLPHAFLRLLEHGPAALPPSGAGQTLQRWRMLASVAAVDLSLLKFYEGHTDAIAILHELGTKAAPGCWGVWAAEPPDAVAVFIGNGADGRLDGRKAWCSGAAVLDHALITARTRSGDRLLVQVALKQPGIRSDITRWKAVGMAATHTGDVDFDGVKASRVGGPGAYLHRPGFWHGALGIAACWYGAAGAVAMKLRSSGRLSRDAHARAHLGAIDASLFAARCALHEAAHAIDAAPAGDAHQLALRVRAIVEAAATECLERTGRALGAAPLCLDAAHAQRCADLTTFLRQSHADSDLEALGEQAMGDDAGGRL